MELNCLPAVLIGGGLWDYKQIIILFEYRMTGYPIRYWLMELVMKSSELIRPAANRNGDSRLEAHLLSHECLTACFTAIRT